MPGPFTHIYTARRVADLLKAKDGPFQDDFIRSMDGELSGDQKLDEGLKKELGRQICSSAMTKWPKFTAVGAIGPDLFFWLQDYNNKSIPCDEIMLAMSLLYYLDDQGRLEDPYEGLLTILAEVSDTFASILRFIIQLEKLWKKFLEVWNKTIGPIVAAAGKVADDLTGGLWSELGTAFDELGTDLLSLAQQELLTAADIFDWFSLKMRSGKDEKAFLWSDMTHYRRTSVVPAQLVVHARKMLADGDTLTKEHGEQLLAFALGWVCHIGTDVIEHSFVNEQCGGPFRTHWQRHHVIENHIDGWNYKCSGDGTLTRDDFLGWQDSYQSIAESALYFAVQIPQDIDKIPDYETKQGDLRKPLPEGDDAETQEARKKLLDTDGALPLWLSETIVRVFIETYADPNGEGGDPDLQKKLDEGPTPPHPQNLMGQDFQKDLHKSTALIGKWLGLLGIDNVGMALDDLRKIIAPDPPSDVTVPSGFPLPWEINTAYRFMLSWFKRQYMSGTVMDRPEEPSPSPLPPLSDILPDPPDFSGVSPSDDPISQACEAILAVLQWAFKELANVIDFIGGVIKSITSVITLPLREEIYDRIIIPLWEVNENIRMVMIHLGYMMPQSEQHWPSGDLKRPNEVDEVLVSLGQSVDSAFQEALAAALDPLGNLDKDPALTNVGIRETLGVDVLNPYLPVRVVQGDKIPVIQGAVQSSLNPYDRDIIEYTRPWAFPNKTNNKDPEKRGNWLEMPLTIAGPYNKLTMPHQLLSTNQASSNNGRLWYEHAKCPEETFKISRAFVQHAGDGSMGEREFRGTNPLGDPVVFSAYLIGQIAHNTRFTSSFNLDADRGYGYLCWDWVRRDPEDKDGPYIIDGRDRQFRPPETWPEGAGPWVRPGPRPVGRNEYDPEHPLKLHYPGRVCDDETGPVPIS